MRCENKINTMIIPRFLARGKNMPLVIIAIDLFIFAIFNYIVNITFNLLDIAHNPEQALSYLSLFNIFPKASVVFLKAPMLYLLFAFVLIILDFLFVYKIHVSWNSYEIAHGQKGSERWTTQEEVREQYKAIPMKDKFFKGLGGTIIQRQGDKLYIDTELTNNLYIGTTRSGKGELYVFPMIDDLSRAEDIKNRPTMIIADPKLELYRSCKATLEERGYKVLLLNMADPVHSIGYNPLQFIIDFYKNGYTGQAQQRARTLGFSIFKSSSHTQEPLWEDSASDLFAALVIAVCSDCIDKDAENNAKRMKEYIKKRNYYEKSSEESKEELIKAYKDAKEDYIISEDVLGLPPEAEFYEVFDNEKKINIYSVLYFFRDLCDRKSGFRTGSAQQREKIANTALDEYFNNRPDADFAKSLYQEVKTTGDKTKGSIYLVMQSAVSIFALDDIAKLTARNEIDIEELGYGEKPVALFMGIPFEDKSNWFIITSFICQAFQYLVFIAREKSGGKEGKLDRNVRFILDEFGNLPTIEYFDQFVTVGLGMGLSFDIFVQSLNQIEAKYKEFYKTILENMAYQIHIKSMQRDTQEAFSKLLGESTIVEVSRTGERLSIDKSYQESSTAKPLLFPTDLAHLREGETVVFRGMKRKDRLGRAFISYPIINEYADPWSKIEKIKRREMLKQKRELRGDKMMHPDRDENRVLTLDEELSVYENEWMWEHGTALKYRWQYLKDTFPDPDTISLKEINPHSQEDKEYKELVYSHLDAFAGKKIARTFFQLNSLSLEVKENLYRTLANIDLDWKHTLDVSEKETCSNLIAKVSSSNYSTNEKNDIYKCFLKMD